MSITTADLNNELVFEAEITDYVLGLSKNKDPQLQFDLKLLGIRQDKWRNDVLSPVPEGIPTLARALVTIKTEADPAQHAQTAKTLSYLGFAGESVQELDPEHPKAPQWRGKKVGVYSTNEGKLWNFFRAVPKQKEKADNGSLRAFERTAGDAFKTALKDARTSESQFWFSSE